jgi:CHAT domain-containing protein
MSQPSQADLASDELDFQRLEYQGETSNFPYANPYWWAGFTVNGLA